MSKNAWKYGWVMSYPLDPDWKVGDDLWSDRICFSYEPWHYRYLGRDVAKAVHDSGLTIREYLWQHYTMVDAKTGEPLPTATPTPSPTPSQTPTPSPTASPTPTATVSAMPSATQAPSEPTSSGPQLDTPALVAMSVAAAAVLGVLLFAVRRRSVGS
jgi:hypothetical protein